jgi:hypothetical protein
MLAGEQGNFLTILICVSTYSLMLFAEPRFVVNFPTEFLEMTVEEALRSRHATVRKLLIDRRLAK